MRSVARSVVCTFVVLIVLGFGWSTVSAQGKTLAWDQSAPQGTITFTSQQAAAYIYRYYAQGTTSGVQIQGVSCTTTGAPLTKTCSVPLPNLAPGTTIDLTASDGANESGHSNTVTVTIPSTPTNFRIALAKIFHAPIAASRKVLGIKR